MTEYRRLITTRCSTAESPDLARLIVNADQQAKPSHYSYIGRAPNSYLRNINIPRAMNDEPAQPLSIVVVIIIYISDIYYSIKYVYTLASAGLHIIVHTVCSRMLGVER